MAQGRRHPAALDPQRDDASRRPRPCRCCCGRQRTTIARDRTPRRSAEASWRASNRSTWLEGEAPATADGACSATCKLLIPLEGLIDLAAETRAPGQGDQAHRGRDRQVPGQAGQRDLRRQRAGRGGRPGTRAPGRLDHAARGAAASNSARSGHDASERARARLHRPARRPRRSVRRQQLASPSRSRPRGPSPPGSSSAGGRSR